MSSEKRWIKAKPFDREVPLLAREGEDRSSLQAAE